MHSPTFAASAVSCCAFCERPRPEVERPAERLALERLDAAADRPAAVERLDVVVERLPADFDRVPDDRLDPPLDRLLPAGGIALLSSTTSDGPCASLAEPAANERKVDGPLRTERAVRHGE